jgi:hypothetical protein
VSRSGTTLSRHAAVRQFRGREVIANLARRGILVRSRSFRGVAEEAPLAYKDVTAVVDAAERPELSRAVARLEPLICVERNHHERLQSSRTTSGLVRGESAPVRRTTYRPSQGFPEGQRAQLDFIPANPAAFRQAAKWAQ